MRRPPARHGNRIAAPWRPPRRLPCGRYGNSWKECLRQASFLRGSPCGRYGNTWKRCPRGAEELCRQAAATATSMANAKVVTVAITTAMPLVCIGYRQCLIARGEVGREACWSQLALAGGIPSYPIKRVRGCTLSASRTITIAE